MVNLATAILACWCGAVPWAESPALLRKATDPSFSAVVASEEVLLRSFGSLAPRSDDRDAPSPGEWRWMGRAAPSLDPREPDSSWQAGFGNEVGDPLFRESVQEHPRNRNPEMVFVASTPRLRGWRAGLRFDQVDHFSDRFLAVRSALLGNPDLADEGASKRRAFVGENLPGHSFIGFGAASDAFGASGGTGWIWLPSPGAGELQCWRATGVAARASTRALEWTHATGLFERADTGRGTVRQSQGWIATRSAGDEVLRARAGFSYGTVDRSADVAWHPRERPSLQPWIELAGGSGPWRFGGFHEYGTDFLLVRDSVGWSARTDRIRASLLVGGALCDRPDGTAPWTDSSRAGIVRMDSRTLEQSWHGRAHADLDVSVMTFSVRTAPWCVVRPHAFSPSSFDTLAEAGGASWIVRAGSERALRGVLRGWKQSVALKARVSDAIELESEARYDPILGGPASRVDIVPPRWAFSSGALLRHPSGLSTRPVLLWRDRSTIRHRSPGDWTVPSGFDANVWIEQAYFGERLVLSMAALNILSNDEVQAPNGAEDRFRLLVRASGRLP